MSDSPPPIDAATKAAGDATAAAVERILAAKNQDALERAQTFLQRAVEEHHMQHGNASETNASASSTGQFISETYAKLKADGYLPQLHLGESATHKSSSADESSTYPRHHVQRKPDSSGAKHHAGKDHSTVPPAPIAQISPRTETPPVAPQPPDVAAIAAAAVHVSLDPRLTPDNPAILRALNDAAPDPKTLPDGTLLTIVGGLITHTKHANVERDFVYNADGKLAKIARTGYTTEEVSQDGTWTDEAGKRWKPSVDGDGNLIFSGDDNKSQICRADGVTIDKTGDRVDDISSPNGRTYASFQYNDQGRITSVALPGESYILQPTGKYQGVNSDGTYNGIVGDNIKFDWTGIVTISVPDGSYWWDQGGNKHQQTTQASADAGQVFVFKGTK
jgi:hypothetical protein